MATRQRPKAYRPDIQLLQQPYGNEVRLGYQQTILRNEPIVPKPLEYEDVDSAFFDFASKVIGITVNGKEVPTFRMFSNQRFSEYSQTWNYVDEEQNLLMNFKTVSRSNNPSSGKNQAGLWNIPGNRWYKVYQRDVLEDNGTEAVEVVSIKQPYAVDMTYRIGFVTNTFSALNRFNEVVLDAFKSCQAYIRPNGHFVAMKLDEISDQTQYTVEERKFYVQQATITVMAYIINKEDMKSQRFPKRINVGMAGSKRRPKPVITAEEYENEQLKLKGMDILIEFEPYHEKVEFDADEDMVVTSVETNNIRSMRVNINGTPYCTEHGFNIKAGDNIRIRFYSVDSTLPSSITLVGHSPSETYSADNTPENVSEQRVEHESIVVD